MKAATGAAAPTAARSSTDAGVAEMEYAVAFQATVLELGIEGSNPSARTHQMLTQL